MLRGKRVIVEEIIDCDTTRLYSSLPEAIAYLQEVYKQYPEATLSENWTSYENMNMIFSFERPETDEEHQHRLRLEDEKKAREAKEAAIKQKALEDRYNKELKKLNEKFGK